VEVLFIVLEVYLLDMEVIYMPEMGTSDYLDLCRPVTFWTPVSGQAHAAGAEPH